MSSAQSTQLNYFLDGSGSASGVSTEDTEMHITDFDMASLSPYSRSCNFHYYYWAKKLLLKQYKNIPKTKTKLKTNKQKNPHLYYGMFPDRSQLSGQCFNLCLEEFMWSLESEVCVATAPCTP